MYNSVWKEKEGTLVFLIGDLQEIITCARALA